MLNKNKHSATIEFRDMSYSFFRLLLNINKCVHRYHSRQYIIALKIEITLLHECSPVNLLHIFRQSCPNYTFVGLPLNLKSIRKRKERCQFRNRLEMFSRKGENLFKKGLQHKPLSSKF